MLVRLPRDVFDIALIYVNENGQYAPFFHEADNVWQRVEVKNPKHGQAPTAWLSDARERIAELDLDLLVYLDLTMSSFCQRCVCTR